MRTLRLILANCAAENGNRCCVALTLSVMYILRELVKRKGMRCVFYLPNSGGRQLGKCECRSGGIEWKYYAIPNLAPIGVTGRVKTVLKVRRTLATRRIYRQADAILDIGEGDSFSDIYGKQRFRSIHAQQELGKRFHLPYCLLPQTIGPFSDARICAKAVEGIKRARCVLTRDRQSFDYVRKIAPGKDVAECIDVAFFMPYECERFEESFVHVGLNVSALLWHGGYTRDNQFGLKSNYQRLVRSVIDYFLSLKGVRLHLVPHVVGVERHIENDYAVSYDLWKEYANANLLLAPMFLDPIIAKGYISGLDFFMGARMHSTIAAFSTGVPVVPMAYSRKFNGLFVDTLSYNDMVDMKCMDEAEALALIKDCFARRDKERVQIGEQMSTTVKEKGELLEKKLSEFLGI